MVNYVTKEGLARLKKELEELKTTRRKELSEKLQRAISEGDLSENADYQEAKQEQSFLEGRISELEQLISSAVIIEEHSGGTAKLGSTVLAERIDKGANRRSFFTIVGSEEADPANGKISHLSPLGAALLGRKPGEHVSITTPQGEATWRLLAVR